MTATEFNATDVRIERWFRSLTRAGQVIVKDGRLALLTSYGREIDSAPLSAVTARRRWFLAADSAIASVNGVRYRLTMGQRNRRPGGAAPVRSFLEALRGGGADTAVAYGHRELRTPTP
ncbi:MULTISPECIES: hypothetical protein [Streptomyces]|uniref:PH domain-containing protein n=2 Tax=Streptomyces TaxID=1883 RepID=A0ABU2RLT0_9ACTN|nr:MULTISPECIES: hypothetical protein [unclassified Streptomyces]MBK3594577.1 hypothetical protein [Streptomyces sp. MBT51]MDT0429800.1 hypothetical protein [Streptomyces sp. DSM 41770]HBF83675.1 hypothetical protein [Streptomyces sp.]